MGTKYADYTKIIDKLYDNIDKEIFEVTKEAILTYECINWIAATMATSKNAQGVDYIVSLLDNNLKYDGEDYNDMKVRFCEERGLPNFEPDLKNAKWLFIVDDILSFFTEGNDCGAAYQYISKKKGNEQ